MSEEAVVFIDDKEIKVSDLTPQQYIIRNT